jgi:predicted transcriptional regulator
MTESAVQLNEAVPGYIRVPYSYYKRHGCRSKILLLSTIFTFSDPKESKTCNFSYSRFEKKLDLSHGTVAREIKSLKESGEITQDKSRRAGAAYSDAKRTKEKGFVKIEFYLYHTQFNVRGEREARYLTKAEIDVLCLIKTHCANERGEGVFLGSARGIAGTLNLSKTTVQKAITTLLRAGLVYRPAEDRGVNGHQRSVYTVNEKLLRRSEKNYNKSSAPAQPSRKALSEEEKAANARADRERYYSELRNRALSRVAFFTDQLNIDDTYRRINAAWKATAPKIARAEVFNLPELEELRKEKRRLGAQRARRMAELMISESDLIPQWHCRMCSDTGFLPNGKQCDCYPERGRRR